jgi:hypothetical protein
MAGSLVVQVNDVPQDVTDVVYEADMSSDRDIAMVRRRRR